MDLHQYKEDLWTCLKPILEAYGFTEDELIQSSTLGIIGNISSSFDILMLIGENDADTPIQQALLLKQRLDETGHRNHELKTYPGLGHVFYPSSKWDSSFSPIQSDVLETCIHGWSSVLCNNSI